MSYSCHRIGDFIGGIMRRSEMLRIIYQASCIEVPSSADAETQLAYRVENILAAIEAAGMLPPVCIKVYEPKEDVEKEFRFLDTKTVCEWEEE